MLRLALRDRPFLAFSALSVLVWALCAQLTLAVPLQGVTFLPHPGQIGYLWTISSLGIVLFQVPVTRWVGRRLHPLTAVAAGTALLGAGLGAVAFSRTFWHLVAAVVIFGPPGPER